MPIFKVKTFNFKHFININEYKKKIEKDCTSIKNISAEKFYSAKQLLDNLSDCLLDYIKKITETVYENILNEIKRERFKVTEKNLNTYLYEAGRYFFNIYDAQLSSYNMGGMFQYHLNFENYKSNFMISANQALADQCNIFCARFCSYLKDERSYYWKVIAAVATILALIVSIIAIPQINTFIFSISSWLHR